MPLRSAQRPTDLHRVQAGVYRTVDGRFRVTHTGDRSWILEEWGNCEDDNHQDWAEHWCPLACCDTLRECKDEIKGCS